MAQLELIAKGVIDGSEDVIESEINNALKEGIEANSIMINGLIKGMTVVGERFGTGDIFLPEMLLSAKIMHKGLDILKPLLTNSNEKQLGRIVIGTVLGDIHNVGKKIVTFLLEGHGFEVIDIGIDVPDESFAQAVQEYEPDVLGMSALLTTTMRQMGKVIELLEAKRLRQKVKIIIGGACITEEFAKSIGADGYAPDANSGVDWIKRVTGNR